MRHQIRVILSVSCLLMAVVVFFAGIHSLFGFGYYPIHLKPWSVMVTSSGGELSLTTFPVEDWIPTFREKPDVNVMLLGFGYQQLPTKSGPIFRLFMPHAFVFAMLLVYPLMAARRSRWWVERKRGRRGLCLACGYDLKMHSAGDRCPECGTVIPARGRANGPPG